MNEIIHQYPAVRYANKINKICMPLIESTPIIGFSMHRIYNNKDYIGFYNNQRVAELMLAKGYLDTDIFTYLANKDHSQEFILWNACRLKNLNRLTRELFEDLHTMGLQSGITLINRYEDYHQSYCFTCKNEAGSGDEFLLDNIPLLKMFILYFKEKVAKDKTLSRVLKDKNRYSLRLNQSHAIEQDTESNDQTSTFSNILVNRYHLNNGSSDIIFTLRDIEFLKLIAQGNTNNDIAKKLQLSPKSIESRIISLRRKTGTTNKRELLQYFLKCNEASLLMAS